jgi:dephospho-CoA kinase
MKLIGLVGPLACGKGVVADYLIKQYGYVSFSLSFIVHDEVKKRGITNYTRSNLQDVGDELRKKEGEGVLAKRALEHLKTLGAEKIIIEGIRNPGEVAFLRTIPGFYLIAVDALREVRYRRVIERGKPWDPKDWETFEKVDGRDSGDGDNTKGQQVRRCMELADAHIENNNDLKQVYAAVERILASSQLI